MKDLEPIIKYKMNEMESKAYKIAVIWQDECRREIPNESFVKLKKNTDPRKSTLFKYCYKLAKETIGILKDNEFPLYIRAQLQILKSIREDKIHALIEPHCLVGDNAWKRWKLWKYKYNKKINKSLSSEDLNISTKTSKVKSELENTFDFLKKRNCIDFNNLKINQDNIERWLKNGELSPFYILLSPWIKKIFKDLTSFKFDQVYYRASIGPEIEEFFNIIFIHEKEVEK